MVDFKVENTHLHTALIIGMCILVLVITFGGLYVNHIKHFLRTRKNIKIEIKRSYTESEHRYWKSRLKRLYSDIMNLVHIFINAILIYAFNMGQRVLQFLLFYPEFWVRV